MGGVDVVCVGVQDLLCTAAVNAHREQQGLGVLTSSHAPSICSGALEHPDALKPTKLFAASPGKPPGRMQHGRLCMLWSATCTQRSATRPLHQPFAVVTSGPSGLTNATTATFEFGARDGSPGRVAQIHWVGGQDRQEAVARSSEGVALFQRAGAAMVLCCAPTSCRWRLSVQPAQAGDDSGPGGGGVEPNRLQCNHNLHWPAQWQLRVSSAGKGLSRTPTPAACSDRAWGRGI